MIHRDKHRDVRDSDLKYLPDMAIVEQITPGGISLYPHTEQLPDIYDAVQREFFEELPNRLVKTDHRADDARKFQLYTAAFLFCEVKNGLRDDGLVFIPHFRKDFVARIAVVQRLARTTPKGKWHFFGLYDEPPVSMLHLNGLPFAFSTHVMDRYAERVCGTSSFSLCSFLNCIFSTNGIFMRLAGGEQALILEHFRDSFIALTYDPEHRGCYFFTTCLTAAQINHLEPEKQRLPAIFHHGPGLPDPVLYNFNYSTVPDRLMAIWKKKILPQSVASTHGNQRYRNISWHKMAKLWRDTDVDNFPPGNRLAFQCNFHTFFHGFIPPGNNPPHPLAEKIYTIPELMEKRKQEAAAATPPAASAPADSALPRSAG